MQSSHKMENQRAEAKRISFGARWGVTQAGDTQAHSCKILFSTEWGRVQIGGGSAWDRVGSKL